MLHSYGRVHNSPSNNVLRWFREFKLQKSQKLYYTEMLLWQDSTLRVVFLQCKQISKMVASAHKMYGGDTDVPAFTG